MTARAMDRIERRKLFEFTVRKRPGEHNEMFHSDRPSADAAAFSSDFLNDLQYLTLAVLENDVIDARNHKADQDRRPRQPDWPSPSLSRLLIGFVSHASRLPQ
jgi:hypothetical protein